ncbi:MAG: tetratricopeptide repeat protein [Myxococcota bacterium]
MRSVLPLLLLAGVACRPVETPAGPDTPTQADAGTETSAGEPTATAEQTPPPQAPDVVEANAVDGRPLLRPVLPDDVYADRHAKWLEAKARYEAAPEDLDAIVWYGRRTAYLGRYQEAIDIFTAGLKIHLDEPHLLRHRGHRFITLRRFEQAERDLDLAASIVKTMPSEVEPDGLPNPAGIPTGTLQTNVYYHLGLALFLQEKFDEALVAYRRCEAASTTDDMRVAVAYWLALTFQRMGRNDEVPGLLKSFSADMPLLENHAYLQLLTLFKGEASAAQVLPGGTEGLDSATLGFGVGHHHLAQGRLPVALEQWRAVVGTDQWAAFGYIAAEVELHRRGTP